MTPFLDLVFNNLAFGLGVPLLVTAGGLLLSDEFKRFGAAKVCFYLAAAWICGRVLMWSVFTSETTYVRVIATFLAFGIIGIGLTESIRATNHRENSLKNSEQEHKKPDVQQSSQGVGSPNTAIIGNNNIVTNSINSSDPKVLAKLEEIRKLIREQQGDRATPDNLLKKYPLGYVIFDISEQRSVFPYATKSLVDHWDFDWSTVKLTENGQENHIWLTMPNMVDKEHQNTFQSMRIGGPKKLGTFGPSKAIIATQNFFIKAEILAIKHDGIVFLIGFTPPD